MQKTLTTIWLGRAGRAEARLETDNAALIIEQKIREAEAGHESAKRGLARLIARARSEERALATLAKRIDDLSGRTREAVEAGRKQLALEAATLVADLENERATREATLVSTQDRIERVRLAVEKTQRQLIDLRQGLITARGMERERDAVRRMQGSASARSALREGEAVLARLLASDDPVEVVDALDEIEADLSGASTERRLAEAGFGAPLKTRAEDVLARVQSKTEA